MGHYTQFDKDFCSTQVMFVGGDQFALSIICSYLYLLAIGCL